MTLNFELMVAEEDPFAPSEEDERDFWNGEGSITFFVEQNIDDIFEIEVLDYTGCVGGLQDTIGIEFYIEEYWGLRPELKEGVTYTLGGVNVEWTRGDGWTTDDDVEYYFDSITAHWVLWTRAKTILYNLWWQNIGWKIRQWRMTR